ncbi:MAG: type II secretion system F family protein [Syntrophomonadaceae bacterium]|nr:type II secretion system F family protein [Syntrophomonadaceae bacterium]
MPLIIIGVFVSIFCLAWVSLDYLFAHRMTIWKRLDDMRTHATEIKGGVEEELQVDFKERIFKPLLKKMSVLAQKYTPVRQKDFIEKRLDYAGQPFGWEAPDFISVQYAVAAGTAILAYILSWAGAPSLGNKILVTTGGFIIGYIFVDLLLRSSTSRHQKAIEKELPDMLDLMTISIEAGLGFDAALQRVVQKSKGPLSVEFNQSLQEMRMGKTRREALKDLGERNGVDDLSKFIEAITQADQLGVSLGNVLRIQSDQMRILRRQRVEERAMKAPIKMLIPMVIFIFPTIFVVVLAPAMIQLMESL